MNKQELIEQLENTKYWEDDFILKYDDDSIWELLKSLSAEKYEKIKKLLAENISDTRKHQKILEDLINDIKSDKYEL
ncbi:hypothetical protein GOV04_02860 [Candidatus Woesearchaeota archaeon]|nr:hypothetical protein [Candidatus Woesearchaeota archaeon]